MTDREAIKALKLEGGLEISGKPRRVAEFLEGLSVAESALQEREERSKGCAGCVYEAQSKHALPCNACERNPVATDLYTERKGAQDEH